MPAVRPGGVFYAWWQVHIDTSSKVRFFVHAICFKTFLTVSRYEIMEVAYRNRYGKNGPNAVLLVLPLLLEDDQQVARPIDRKWLPLVRRRLYRSR